MIFTARSLLVTAQSDITGLDVAVIINNGYRQLQRDEITTAQPSVYQAVRTLAQYLSDRHTLMSEDEQHTLSVIRFDRDNPPALVIPQQALPLSGTATLEELLRPPAEPGCEGCISNFVNPFEMAVNQLNNAPSGSTRRRIIILITDDVFGSNNTSSAQASDFTRMGAELKTAIDGWYNQLYIYGLDGRNIDQANWNGNMQVWDGAGIRTTSNQFIDVNELENVLQASIIEKVRALLPTVGRLIETGDTLAITPYQDSFSVFFFRSQANQRLSLNYRGDLGENNQENRLILGDAAALIQVITIENPRPGNWQVQVDGGTPATGALEMTERAATIQTAVEAQSSPIYPSQPLRLVWRSRSRSNTILNYEEALLNINATIRAGDKAQYNKTLQYDRQSGEYWADFYPALAEPHTVDFSVSGASLVNPTPELTFRVASYELLVNTPTAQQFQDWQFTAFFAPSNSATAVEPNFAVIPTLDADLTWADGNTQPIEMRYDEITGIYTSQPLNITYHEDFQLRLTASIPDANAQQVTLPTRAVGGTQIVTLWADAGIAMFTNAQPRLLDTVEIQYRPSERLKAVDLDGSPYNARIVAHIAEAEGDATWDLPMELSEDQTYYTAQFYATRDVAHSLTIRGVTGDRPFIDLSSNQLLDPLPITVRFVPTDLHPLQTVPYQFNFEIHDGGTLLGTPFTSGVAVNARLMIEPLEAAGGEPYQDVPLEADSIGRYSGSIERFQVPGDHQLNVLFEVLESPSDGREPRLISLPVSNTDQLRLEVKETLYLIPNIRIENSSLSEAREYSTGIVPFSARQPLVFDVELQAIRKSIADDNNIPLEQKERQSVSPPSAFRGGSADDWYQIEIKRGDDVVDPSLYVTQPIPNGDLYLYQVTGLPDDDYTVTVKLNSALQLEGDYGFQESQLHDLVKINYATHPAQIALTVLLALAIVLIMGYLSRRRYTANRVALPAGHLYLLDPADRVLWSFDMGTNIKTNSGSIGGGQGFERALINRIDVVSDRRLKSDEKLRVRVVIGTTPQPEITMDENHQPVPIGDGRFKLGRSSQAVQLHSPAKELERIQSSDY